METKFNGLFGGCPVTQYGCCPDGTTAKIDKKGSNCPIPNPTPTPAPAPPQREYDQIVSADVKIKKLCNSDDEYKITFVGNVSKVLMYQVWSPTSAALNNDRKVFEVGAKKWVKAAFRNLPSAVPYKPTCVMELEHDECPIHDHKNEECRHVFVINKAKINSNGKIVFYVSSEDIDPNNKNKVIKKIKKIPKGEYHNARFDIDASQICTNCGDPVGCDCWT
jgi:hypothetical protein